MRRFALAAATLAAFAAPARTESLSEAQRAAAATITPQRCRAHVDFLASDLLEGRATPSRGLEVAASYVASHFERLGLEPGGAGGTYLQAFPILREVRLASSALARGDERFEQGEDYIPLPMTGDGKAAGEVVFAGYGITAPDEGYDDYAGIDVQGKVVLVLRHEPQEGGGSSAFAGKRLTRHSFFASKLAQATKRGAAALLLVTDPTNHDERGLDAGRWPSRGGDDAEPASIPAAQVTRALAEKLLGRDLLALQQEIDETLEPRSFAVAGPAVALEVATERVHDTVHNVVAILPGSDPELRGEAVVIGAHYDHVGVQGEKGPAFFGQMGRPKGDDRIHNGADDNASGTSALLEVARALGESGARPRRAVVFIAFAGEELGLLGSEWYCEHPLVPIEKTVAMLNLDMVGRNDPEKLFLGGKASDALKRAFEAANAQVGMKITPLRGRNGYGSDHDSFDAVEVPTLFFFSGDHPDYHRVTDEPAKIEAAKIARVARLAFLTALEVANDPAAGARPARAPGPREGGDGRWF